MEFSIKNYYKDKLFENRKITIYLINGEEHVIKNSEYMSYEDDDVFEYLTEDLSMDAILIFKNQIVKIVNN
ncbi:hypothetical protein NGB25_00105 [Staphylococcus saprophyticus]|uniref:hypothetical protein n=1 Tax=Staphylococcus saprophyticus TaxID=29385 RepID=UPI002DBC841E|nr:hypothetical protein [Staphylococcus saprophyticus]MEB7675560.1 hypothetical protein [Staphylococcus saprophyticus]